MPVKPCVKFSNTPKKDSNPLLAMAIVQDGAERCHHLDSYGKARANRR